MVDYTFAVTNTGNVTLYGVSIDDRLVGVSGIVCEAPTTLAPGDMTTCTGTYDLTQEDIDRGLVTNTATAVADTPPDYMPSPGPSAPVESNEAPATVDIPPHPSLELQKEASVMGTGPNDAVTAGDRITYTYLVTNDGNVTVRNLSVTDHLSPPALSAHLSPIECGTNELAPEQSTTCTAYYEVTQDDLDAHSVHNTATASGAWAPATPP